MLSETIGAVLVGLAAGAASVWWAAQYINRFLFGVTAFDPVALTVAASLLTLAALAAIYVPSRRALRLDPTAALRAE
jgi:ABC-type antimicrobial peptide transport system permease subunit